MGWLRILREDGTAEFLEIVKAGVVVGRSVSADLTIEGSRISRRHAKFFTHQQRDWVRDLGSTNGVRVAGERIEKAAPLSDGDEVLIGDFSVFYDAIGPDSLASDSLPRDLPPTVTGGEPIEESSPALTPIKDEVPLADTDRWRDVKMIGRGGMGEVYRAFDRDLATKVAIKRLRRRDGSNVGVLERLHAREASIARTIRHPNVVQVLEDGVHDGDPYMLLEWVDGPAFDAYVRKRLGSLPDRVECLRQISLGLAAAHAAGVVHADLKPANILILPDTSRDVGANLGILESPDERTEPEGIDAALSEEIERRLEDSAPAPDFDDPPYVGRESELAFLNEVVDEFIASGDPLRWILVYGERGAGKQRLCDEFRVILEGRQSGIDCVVDADNGVPEPAADRTPRLWFSLFPPLLPDHAGLFAAYERLRSAGQLRELYLKPFLRGQSIRLVERLIHHAPSARAFVDVVEREVGGNPERLLARLQQSFDIGAWRRRGLGFRFDREVLAPDDNAVARRLFGCLRGEEKGLQDLLLWISPLGSSLSFETILAATETASATLFYLLEHATQSGFLLREAKGDYRYPVEAMRRALESKLDSKLRTKIIRRALPTMHKRLDADDAPASVFYQIGRLERQNQNLELAFRVLVRGALRARQQYERSVFLASIDEAREIYRLTANKRNQHKAIAQVLEEMLGEFGRGMSGLDRLRRLPIAVRSRLTDFGIARKLVKGRTTEEDDDGQPWGTPRFMSPEQAKRSALTPASDIFSLGIIAREVFESKHPLGKLKGREAIRAIANGAIGPPLPGAVPKELHELISRMLSPKAKARPSALEVAQALERYQFALALDGYS